MVRMFGPSKPSFFIPLRYSTQSISHLIDRAYGDMYHSPSDSYESGSNSLKSLILSIDNFHSRFRFPLPSNEKIPPDLFSTTKRRTPTHEKILRDLFSIRRSHISDGKSIQHNFLLRSDDSLSSHLSSTMIVLERHIRTLIRRRRLIKHTRSRSRWAQRWLSWQSKLTGTPGSLEYKLEQWTVGYRTSSILTWPSDPSHSKNLQDQNMPYLKRLWIRKDYLQSVLYKAQKKIY